MIPAGQLDRARAVDIALAAQSLGAALRRISASERVGACIVCGGRDRFSVNIKKQVWHCRGCGGGGGAIDLVRHVRGCDFREAVAFLAGEDCINVDTVRPDPKARPKPPAPEPKPKDDDNREIALALWREGVDPRGTIVEKYLASRGLRLSLDDAPPSLADVRLGEDISGTVLRWHPRIGAMLALFRNIETDAPQAISRTFLDRHGCKIGRRFLGPVSGAAIMLDRVDIVLNVCEGIENGMTGRQLGWRPVWALGSAGALAAFPVLDSVERLTVFVDHDLNGVGEKAANEAAARWIRAGRTVRLFRREVPGDFNDALMESAK